MYIVIVILTQITPHIYLTFTIHTCNKKPTISSCYYYAQTIHIHIPIGTGINSDVPTLSTEPISFLITHSTSSKFTEFGLK